MWRKRLRLAIAGFVVIFAVVLVVSLRRGAPRPMTAAKVDRLDPKAAVENRAGGVFEHKEQGKTTFSITFGAQLGYQDGRMKLSRGVKVLLPDKNGRSVRIESQEADLVSPPDRDIGHAEFTGGVTLTTSDGVTARAARASYDDNEGIVRIPGPVTFAKGRMTGSGVGATYDRNREVLWLLAQAKIDAAPDEQGSGAVHATSASAGFARPDHYLRFTGNATLEGEGRVTHADEATVMLSSDDQHVQRMELRGHSTITGTGTGPQSMQARDIDLGYSTDGRTLQTAKLMESASVQLRGAAGQPGRRVSGRNIDVMLAPDGATVTGLTSTDNVQVDLPAAGDTPARRIRSATLVATGAPGAGLQQAAFAGNVEFRESRSARKSVEAVDRTVRAQRLDVRTQPGFGDLERADFHSSVHLTDGPDTTADAPLAVYAVSADRLDLLPPAAGETGLGPHVNNGRIAVDAVRIAMTLGSKKLSADSKVRSVLQPQSGKPAAADRPAGGGRPARGGLAPVAPLPPPSNGGGKMPSMLKQDQPVNVTANRLDYDGTSSLATYKGNARLWQEDTVVQADTIALDDKNGNLHAKTNVRTVMTLKRAEDDATKPGQPTTTVADELVYEDANHRATYTTKAHMSGPDGDVTAERIELYLSQDGAQLERAEAYEKVVSRQQTRRAYGDRLTYIVAKDLYTMVGAPVEVFDDTPPDCKVTRGTTLTFHKTSGTIQASGNGVSSGAKSVKIDCASSGSR